MLNGIMAILYLSSFVVAFSLIAITLKRCRTLGYSKIVGWTFAIISYISYFSLSALSNYYQYKSESQSGYRGEISDVSSMGMVIPTGLTIVGIFIISMIVIIILLSKQVDTDYQEEVDYYAYDSINSIFGLIKFSLAFAIIFVLWKLSLSWLAQSPTFAKIVSLTIIIAYVCFYLNIFIKRSRDAGINSAFIITAFFSLIAIIVIYLIGLGVDYFDDKPLLSFFLNRLTFTIISIYILFSYIIIALPSKKKEYGIV